VNGDRNERLFKHADILPALVQGLQLAGLDGDDERLLVAAAGLRSYWRRIPPGEQQDLLDALNEYGLGMAVRIAVLHGELNGEETA
jgi:hypothetical protein